MSLLVGPLGPLSELFYLRDYWRPELFNNWQIGVEDFLFGFAIGGIAAVLYEEIFSKYYSKRHLKQHPFWMLWLAGFGAIWMLIGNFILGFNSIYVSSFGFIIIGLIILLFRHDLIKDGFFSGLLVGGTMFGFYLLFFQFYPEVVTKWWLLDNISGILIAGVPIEELMWGFGWGLIAGPLYEFMTGLRFQTNTAKIN